MATNTEDLVNDSILRPILEQLDTLRDELAPHLAAIDRIQSNTRNLEKLRDMRITMLGGISEGPTAPRDPANDHPAPRTTAAPAALATATPRAFDLGDVNVGELPMNADGETVSVNSRVGRLLLDRGMITSTGEWTPAGEAWRDANPTNPHREERRPHSTRDVTMTA